MKLSKIALIGLLPLCLMACGTRWAVSDQAVMATAPVEFLDETPEPELTGPRTNQSLVDHILALREALRSANDDKAMFRWWWKENTK